jgi:hypothetical protein
MSTFDEILPMLTKIFQPFQEDVTKMKAILVNRDLNGRVRLIVDEKWENNEHQQVVLDNIARQIHEGIGFHAYPAAQAVLFEPDIDDFLKRESCFLLEGISDVFVIDRLAVEGNWSRISRLTSSVSRTVFFSIKGGVGRSTALAATAWALAEQGKKVLVLDLDLESPGLSSALLPEDRRPFYGITDWLVEDLVNNGAVVFENMVATSALSHNGEILVVPAHGANPGEYIAKLGRVWMPSLDTQGKRESWSDRLRRLLDDLEGRWQPDVTLIDSRAGIDEVASACITELSASTILLFAIDGDQTWSGYRVLFQHWRKTGVVRDIRERLQIVGAMIPEVGTEEYVEGLLERAWDLFSEELYDEVPAGKVSGEESVWSYDQFDGSAPHYPWSVKWHRSFAVLKSLHGRLKDIDPEMVRAIFGPLIAGMALSIETDGGSK